VTVTAKLGSFILSGYNRNRSHIVENQELIDRLVGACVPDKAVFVIVCIVALIIQQ